MRAEIRTSVVLLEVAIWVLVASAFLLAGCTSASEDVQETVDEPVAEIVADAGAEVDDAAGGPGLSEAGGQQPEVQTSVVETESKPTFVDIPTERVIGVDELQRMLEAGDVIQLVDVRTSVVYTHEHIDGSVNIPAAQFSLRIDEVATDDAVILIDKSGERVAEVRQMLIDAALPEDGILVVEGGLDAWKAAGYPTVEAEEGMYQC